MAKSKQEIIAAVDAYMRQFQYPNSDWYVGIAADPQERLFNGLNVDEDNGFWIYEHANSVETAREVEQAYLVGGHDGGGGGGSTDSTYVYAYVKLQGTVR